ncbi:adenosylhomocysteinase 3 isoform X1, partial [Brachionus plicatilis]
MSSKNQNSKGNEDVKMNNLSNSTKHDILPLPKIESTAQISNLASFLRSNSSLDSPSKLNMMTVNYPLTQARPRITDRYRYKDSRRNSNVIDGKQRKKEASNISSNAKSESQKQKTLDSVTDYDSNEASDIEDEISPRLKEQVNKKNFTDFCVRNIDDAEHGRKEIQIAEQEMPGLMSLRRRAEGD